MSLNTPTLRKANPDDSQAIAAYNIAMALETEGKKLEETTVQAGVASLFNCPELGFYLVAEINQQIVATLMITTEWSDWRNGLFWWIQSVYVKPNSRRQGIFSQLYRYVESLAEEDPRVCGFRLYVEQENNVAQATYQSLGMKQTHYRLFET